MARRARGMVAGLVMLAAGVGCGKSTACDGTCPSVAGTYALQTVTSTGECPYTPMILPPTVQLAQTPDGRAQLTVLDPVNQVQVPLEATLFSSDHPGTVATMQGFTRQLRQATLLDQKLVNFQITFTASVVDKDGTRFLSGSLQTISLPTASTSPGTTPPATTSTTGAAGATTSSTAGFLPPAEVTPVPQSCPVTISFTARDGTSP